MGRAVSGGGGRGRAKLVYDMVAGRTKLESHQMLHLNDQGANVRSVQSNLND